MKKNKPIKHVSVILLFLAGALLFYGSTDGSKTSGGVLYKITQESGKVGNSYRFNINNINLPFNTNGTMADVNIPPDGTLGKFGGHGFLYSGGFMISGYANGTLWGCAQATASRISNFIPGRAVPQPTDDPQMYVILKTDPAFGQSWQDWKDAVALGADFYDGDGDGIYNPSDKNGNGIWDMASTPGGTDGEDAPDLLGDATAWCLFNDGIPAAQRERFVGIEPQGIEIRQTVFAFASAGSLGNLIFIRYRLSNAGTVAQSLDSVIFAVWADADDGDATDDLVGVDVSRNAGFTYQKTPDAQYGINPPCFMIDFFSGPAAYIAGETFTDVDLDGKYTEGVDTPLDTAYSNRGQVLGIKAIPGAKNLPISSFVHYQQSDPILGDPANEFEARYYMKGTTKVGDTIDVCSWNLGNGPFPGCETTNPFFWYSGDPVTGEGWLNVIATDQRQMQNTGPFQLEVGTEVEIVVAYVVGQAPSDAVKSVDVAKEIDDGAQFIFDQNFLAPSAAPPINAIVESGSEFIDLILPVSDQVGTSNVTEGWNIHFQGINVYAYKTNSTAPIVGGQDNKKLYKSYSASNFIKNVYKEDKVTGGKVLLYPVGDVVIDTNIYRNPETGLIRIRVDKDPWTGESLVKGKPYYFAFTTYLLNYDALVPMTPGKVFGDVDDYYLSLAAFVGEVENIDRIYSHYDGDPDGGVKLGEELYAPPLPLQPSNKIAGPSEGEVFYDVVKKDELQNGQYEITFFKDSSSTPYKMFWKVTNVLTNTVLLDTSDVYSLDQNFVNLPVTEGFITRVEEQNAKIGSVSYTPSSGVWYASMGTAADTTAARGIWYVGKDLIPTGTMPPPFTTNRSTYLSNDKLRRVELRFGPSDFGKAYRYINGYVGTPATNNYTYASRITSTDTTNKGVIGMWDVTNNRAMGFVDVPFQAWVVDEQYDQEYQLAVGFIERRKTSTYPLGNPDGIWDPDTILTKSGEMIAIFSSPYDATGSQIELTGGDFETTGSGTVTRWADLARVSTNIPVIPPDAVGITAEQKAIFASPWLSTMYLVGLERNNASSFFLPGDILTIPLEVYPYTESDIYSFVTSKATLSEEGEKELWNKVNVFPNPLYGFNPATSYSGGAADEPFVTFSNLPTEVTVKIYSLSGQLLRTINQEDKVDPTSPFLRWNLENESGLRVASGMYLAIVSSPKYGEKVLKFAIIMPQKQIQKY
jgi:hypothetical protein